MSAQFPRVYRLLYWVGLTLLAVGCGWTLDFEGDCLTDQGCAALGDTAVCRAGQCVLLDETALLSSECDRFTGLEPGVRFDADAHLLLGVLTPRRGPALSSRTSLEAAAVASITDINLNGGIDGRPLVGLLCDDGAGNPAKGIASARHLVELGAQAIVGPVDTEPTLEIYAEVALPSGVLMVSPGAPSPGVAAAREDLESVDRGGLLWRIRTSSEVTAMAVADWMLAQGMESAVVAYRQDDWGLETEKVLSRRLCDQGGPCGRTYRGLGFTPNDPDLVAPIATALAESPPDVMVIIADALDQLYVFNAAADVGFSETISIEGEQSAFAVSTFIGQAPTVGQLRVMCRALGTTGGELQSGPIYDEWRRTFEARPEHDGIDVVVHAPLVSDAIFVTAFGMALAVHQDRPIDGNNIAAGLAQLSEGASTPTSGLGWVAGHAKLAAGQPIDLVGASGPLDFDPETNDVRSRAVTLWRYNLDLGVPETIGQLYDAAGQYRAPEFGGLLTDETCAPYR